MRHMRLLKGLEKLEERLSECKSATRALEEWCEEHGLVTPARIGAITMAQACKKATQDQLERLQVQKQDDVAYRQVRLLCADLLVCEADNWFVPSRLTDAMNIALQTTDTPFGKVVAPLQPYRDTYSMTVFEGNLPWSSSESETPGEERWAYDGSQDLLHHRGLVLQRADNLPLAEVHETFKMVLLEPYVSQR